MEIKDLVKNGRSFEKYGFANKGGGTSSVSTAAPTIDVADGAFVVTAVGADAVYYRMQAATGDDSGWTLYEDPVAVTPSTAEVTSEYDIISAYAVKDGMQSDTTDESHFVRPILTDFQRMEGEDAFGVVVPEDTDATLLTLEYHDTAADEWLSFYTEDNPSGEMLVPFDDEWLLPQGEITVRAYTSLGDVKSVSIEITTIINV